MAAIVQKRLSLFVVFLFLISTVRSQKIVTVDFCIIDPDTPVMLNDTTLFYVYVTVDDTSATDDNTLYGDLYYWYQTDSMLSAGIPPGFINILPDNEFIPIGGKLDTISIAFQAHEIRPGPVNVICIWAAMQLPEIEDTIPCCNMFGFITGVETNEFLNKKYNVVFPNPVGQYLHIVEEEINQVSYINFYTIGGKMIRQLRSEEFTQGIISLETLEPGYYLVELYYQNGTITRSKILKQ